MMRLFHVSSAVNRESILAHGLDWTRMGSARGIAGSTAPEEQGVFLCRDESEARFFVDMNNTGDPVDVWEVTGIAEGELVTGDTGFCYFPAPIPPAQVTLADWPQAEPTPAAPRRRLKKKQPKRKPRAGK
jgi:hypothetical protein